MAFKISQICFIPSGLKRYHRQIKFKQKILCLLLFIGFFHFFYMTGKYQYAMTKIEHTYMRAVKFILPKALRYHLKGYYDGFYTKPTLVKTNYRKNASMSPTCNPYKQNYSPFSVIIDNVKYPRHVPLSLDDNIDFDCLNKNTDRKRILFWNTWFGQDDFGYGLGKREPFISNNCPVSNCELTTDKSLFNTSDLIIMHLANDFEYLPRLKFDFQQWMLMVYESPLNSKDYSHFDGLFELTTTYRSTSDVTSFYFASSPFRWSNGMFKNFDHTRNYMRGKKNFLAVLISNCHDRIMRLDYINDLAKYIPVKIYGRCGEPCPVLENKTCRQYIAENYKFFFSIENSFCDDYITEKFFEILKFDIVPVVLGGGDYELYVPKSGFVNALDFKSPEKLGKYLIQIARDKQMYNSFFKWKKYVDFDVNIKLGHICEMCILLNLNSLQQQNYFNKQNKQIIESVDQFWNREKHCKFPIRNLDGTYTYEH